MPRRFARAKHRDFKWPRWLLFFSLVSVTQYMPRILVFSPYSKPVFVFFSFFFSLRRIKVCLEGSGTDMQTVIHEMGHVHYFMAYRHQPSLLRAAPLSALHEAIGECFSHVETCDLQGYNLFKTYTGGSHCINVWSLAVFEANICLPWGLSILLTVYILSILDRCKRVPLAYSDTHCTFSSLK